MHDQSSQFCRLLHNILHPRNVFLFRTHQKREQRSTILQPVLEIILQQHSNVACQLYRLEVRCVYLSKRIRVHVLSRLGKNRVC